jgi:hypothetical protein
MREVLVSATAEHLEEELVHRPEVVVDKLRLEAGPRTDSPGGDRRVPVLQKQLLSGIEESDS